MPNITVDSPITVIPHTSSITFNKFKSIDINTVWNLLNYFPYRYENYSIVSTIAQAQEGEAVTIKGTIVTAKNEYTRNRMIIQKVTIQDETGTIDAVWYNQPYLITNIKKSPYISVSGPVKRFGNKFSISPTEYESLKTLESEAIHTGRLVPIYSELKGLSTKTVREKIYLLLHDILKMLPQSDLQKEIEFLPAELIKKYSLQDALKAYYQVHFPRSYAEAEKARERLAFDELFIIQVSSMLIKKTWEKETLGLPFKVNADETKKLDEFIENLPFPLTNAQKRVVDEIIHDLKSKNPMNRFVQGDVGSGKTVVAAIAAYLAHLNGYQTLYMAPTEILAQQHFATISKLFSNYKLKIGLHTGAVKIAQKSKTEKVSNYDLVIGTHALISESISFDKVGLVIIDEQHRFGVAQRAKLKQKGINPHLMTMTATPIPRTITLTLYGELDLSVIDEMPKGRLPIKTHLVPSAKRLAAYEWIKKQIKAEKTQVFVICPLIEESETETMKSVKAATKEYEHLKTTVFKEFSVGMLHGKVKPKEKEQVMQDFKNKKYDILVATSVVEVGIDVPNATIMIIEGAERYGLAQLHQLRGRVGRGEKQSYCFLFTAGPDANTFRLGFFARTNKGISLAEFDLKKRGPGQIYGTQQHGYDDLNIADLSDLTLVEKTQQAAQSYLEKYSPENFPALQKRIEKYRVTQIARD